MRVFITGVTGFIGYSLSKYLVGRGFKVYGLVRPSSTTRKVPEGVEVISGDLTDYHSLVKAVKYSRPEVVVHLGALTPVSESFKMPRAYIETNLIGTINLAEALIKHTFESLRLFAFAGTTEMFDTDKPISPETPFSPTSPYSVSKISAHYYLEYLRKTYGFPYVTVVPTNTYGRAYVMQKHFVIEKIITSMLEGRKKILMGNPTPRRDFMFRDDHVMAYVSIITAVESSNKLESVIGRVFTFGTGKSYSIAEVFDKCREIIGWDGEVVWGVYGRPNEPKTIVVDYSESKKILGWTPRYDLESGLRRAVKEWREVLGV